MNMPLVSVAIATWNGQRFLREQLDSIYAQTWRPIEVVVSDDASTDGTVAILEEYARSQGLHYFVNPERLGLVRNFERAICMATGEFVALCDQDDLWKPQKIATLVDHIGDATLIYGRVAEYLDVDGRLRSSRLSESICRFARAHGTGHPTPYLTAENWIVSHSMLFRRQLISHAVPIPARQRFHDGWLALVASKLAGIVYIDETLQTYRRHPSSFTFAPNTQSHNGTRWVRFIKGRFAADWRDRCISETERLSDVLTLPLLDAADQIFAKQLICYYRSGLEPGHRWRSFYSGLRISRFFATQQDSMSRCRIALKGLLASRRDVYANQSDSSAESTTI